MPISFEIHADQGYYISIWEGDISDADLEPFYESVFNNEEYKLGFHEIADVTNGNLSGVTSKGLRSLAIMARQFMGDNCKEFKTAAVVPEDLNYGMARIYQVFSSDSVETVKVFRNLDDALKWVKEE